MALHEAEFTDLISSAALSSQRIKGNSLLDFPDETDMRMLKEFQVKKMQSLAMKMSSNQTPDT